jgi:hypothetical protein
MSDDFTVDPESIAKLEAAMRRDEAAERGETPAAAPSPGETQQGAESATSEAEVAPEGDLGSAPSIDDVLAALPEEHREAVKEAYDARVGQFQGTFTQKTQELAEQRKAYEAIGSPEDALEAKEFYDSIRYDTEFATDIYEQLGEALGVSPAEAQQVAEAAAAANATDDYGLETETDTVDTGMQALRTEVQQMRAELAAEREQAQFEEQKAALTARIASQEAEVRTAHPDWDDDMIETVYAIGSSSGVDIDLVKSAEQLAATEQAAIARYLEKKTADQTPAVTGGAGEGHVPTEPPESLDAGHVKAQELWRALKADEAAG